MSFNMPPGVSVNDIPGNRPEDLAEEAWWDKLGELCPDVPEEVWDDERVQKLVESARDLAYSTGYDEGRAEAELAAAMRESDSVEPQPQDRGLAAALAEVGLPAEASVADLIRHHRNNAALAAGFDLVSWVAWARRHSDAIDGGDGSLAEHGDGCLICKAVIE